MPRSSTVDRSGPPATRRESTTQSLAELHRQARAVLAHHYRKPLTLAVVARALASSPRQLQRAFAEAGHTTFSAQLTAVRLRNGAELLAQSALTVDDVARLVGYRQRSHFGKAFRQRYGVSPAEFRALRREAARRARSHQNNQQGGKAR
jgi:transcriptional regulator GlxA family with amidase domain